MTYNEVEALNVVTKKWRTLPSLHEGRHGTQAFIYDDKVYAVAGCGAAGGTPELNSLEAYGCH